MVLVGLVSLSCLSDPFTGSTVVVDFLNDLEPSNNLRLPDGSRAHYELWVQFADLGVYSVGTFTVDARLHINAYPDEERRIGSVTGADDLRRSGVQFVVDADFEAATDAFVTLEPNGETDIAPSPTVIMSGALTRERDGELRGELSGQYQNRFGDVLAPTARITVIIAEDNAFF